MQKGDKVLINDSLFGNVVVTITEVEGNIVHFENKLKRFRGSTSKDQFEEMILIRG